MAAPAVVCPVTPAHLAAAISRTVDGETLCLARNCERSHADEAPAFSLERELRCPADGQVHEPPQRLRLSRRRHNRSGDAGPSPAPASSPRATPPSTATRRTTAGPAELLLPRLHERQ